MKLVSFKHNGSARIGVIAVRGERECVLDLNSVDPDLPSTMVRFLEAGEGALMRTKQALARAEAEHYLNMTAVTITAPIPRPGKIMCLGLNYKDHARESNEPLPQYPTVFSKYPSCVIGPMQPIVLPQTSRQVDFEVELGCVIGKRVRFVSEAEALDYVAGYVAFNDVSARDYQTRTSQWLQGKTFDTFGPMGPALVTTDDIPDPGVLELSLHLNGKKMQHSNTKNLVFSVPYLISYLSQIMTLEPGDLLSTGTPGGVGFARKPQVFLKAGDEVRIHIDRIGTLVNSVVDEQ